MNNATQDHIPLLQRTMQHLTVAEQRIARASALIAELRRGRMKIVSPASNPHVTNKRGG